MAFEIIFFKLNSLFKKKCAMKYLLAVIVPILISIQGFPQDRSSLATHAISSGKYTWVAPGGKGSGNILSSKILSGTSHDFSWLEVASCSLPASANKNNFLVPDDEEHLFIIKSGNLAISFGDSSWIIGPGSIALLLPGESFSLQSEEGTSNYYLMKYRSRQPADHDRGKVSGGSFVRDWNKLMFRPHGRGGVRSYFERPTTMSSRFEMHVTTLNPGLKSHDPHTHRAEEIILMLEDTGEGKSHTEMLIGDKTYRGHAGDLYYVGSNLLHGIKNIGTAPCSYFAFQFE